MQYLVASGPEVTTLQDASDGGSYGLVQRAERGFGALFHKQGKRWHAQSAEIRRTCRNVQHAIVGRVMPPCP